jgi:hypothetical protein
VLIQADLAFGGLEALLDRPADASYPNESGEGDRSRCPAAVEGQFAGGDASADEQPVVSVLLVGGWGDA